MHACSYTVGGKKAARLPRLWTLNYFLVLLHLSRQLMITYQENNLFNRRLILLMLIECQLKPSWSTFCQWAHGDQPQLICSNLLCGSKGKVFHFGSWRLPPPSILTNSAQRASKTYIKKNPMTLSPDSPQQNSLKSLCKSARTLVIVKHWLTHGRTPVTVCYDKEQLNVGNMSWSWKFRILHLIDVFLLYLKHGFIIHHKHKISAATSHC